MKQYFLENEKMTVTVNQKGAELVSLKKDGKEYLWNANPEFWGRSAPILFPFVGGLKNKQYTHEGKTYEMGQHGFARDMEFTLVEQTRQSLKFALESNEDTMKLYPFEFCLSIEYILQDNHLGVFWEVQNPGKKKLCFSIGGHPGFMCPIDNQYPQTDYSIRFYKNKAPLQKITSMEIGDVDGLINGNKKDYELKNGLLSVSGNLFDHDALVLEDYQTDEISFIDPAGKAYVTVRFTTPLVGVWSPAKKNAPFICVEPWCGRCDHTNFKGELSEREYGNTLESGGTFQSGFDITLE